MWITQQIRRTGNALLALFYPPHCAICRGETISGAHLCGLCQERARRIDAPYCRICSQPFDGAMDGEFTCANCHGRKFHFSMAISRYRATSVVRDLIHRFKYDGHVHLRHQLASWLLVALEDDRIRSHPFQYLVPVPLHPARKREREFNQAEVLARALASRAGLPVLNCLRRIRYTSTQTRLDRQERMENLRNAFQVRQTSRVPGSHLILVDDVFTTGSTVDECARILLQAGAASIRVITVARG